MQVQATQHVHLIAVRYVEDSIRKASHYRIGGERFLDFGLGGRLVDDPSGHLRSLRDQLAANVVQSDADFIRIRPMMGQAVP